MTNHVSKLAHGINIYIAAYKRLSPQGSKKNVTRKLTFRPVYEHPVINSNTVYQKHFYYSN